MTTNLGEELQRTAQWFEDRKGRITGSVAGAALGVSPWLKPEQLLRQMVREYHGYPSEQDFSGNPAISYGNNHERAAQLMFTKTTGLDVQDVGFLRIDEWAGASPDGLTNDGGVLELKCPYGLRNQRDPEFKSLEDQPHYYAQVQFEIMAAERTHAYFAQYRPAIGDMFDADYCEPVIKITKHGLDKDWASENMPKLHAFYELYLSEIDNKVHLEPLRVSLCEPEHQRIVDYISELDDSIHAAQDARRAALDDLIEMAGGKDADVCGKKLTKVERKGSVSAASLMKKFNIDKDEAEKLRGKPSVSWRFS